MIPAVAYYRMSSDKQEASIGDQRVAVEAYAAAHNYRITREYLDEGVSGWKSEQRKGFQKLIEDTTSGDFKAVLCWDQDRFSRFPVLEANHYWYLLDRAGVYLETVAQGRLNFEDLGEWLKASVVQHGKAEYVRDLARNTTRGLRKRKLAGRWVGCAPLGYRLNDGKLELGDPEKVAVVQRIFSERARGYGVHTIARKLNNEGIPTPRASAYWSTVLIRHVLQRDAYIGHTVIGKHARGKYERLTPEIVTIANTHPAIIDQETWDAVHAMPKYIRRANGRCGSEGAALSGLLKCGRCGQPMYAITMGKTDYYLCASYHRKGNCGHCKVRRQPILKAVAEKLRQQVLMGSPARLEAAIQRQLNRRQKPVDDKAHSVRRLAQLDQQIARAGDRLLTVDDSLVPELEKRLLALKRQRDQLAETVDVSPKPKRLPSAKAIAAKIWELDRVLSEAPATTVRHVLRQLIEEIRLDFDFVGETRKGKSYRFTGGVMRLLPQTVQPLETWLS